MSPESTDQELVLASLTGEGDSVAYGLLIERHHQAIYHFLFQLTNNRHDAEDLTQETFLHALKQLGKFKTDQPFRPWLFTLARRMAITSWRRKKPSVPLMQDDHPELENSRQPHDAIALWQLARRNLKSDEFTALWLHYQEGLSVKELARVLRKTTTHAKVILHRARKNLRSHLEATPEKWSLNLTSSS